MPQMAEEIQLEQITRLEAGAIGRNFELIRSAYLDTHNDINTKEWLYFTANGKKWRTGSDPDGDDFLFQRLDSGDWKVQSNWITRVAFPLSGSVTLPGFTEGSILFANAAETIDEDNDNLFWNDSTNTLDVNGITVNGTRDIGIDFTGTFGTAIQRWPAGTIQSTGDIVFQGTAGTDSTARYQWLDAAGTWPVLGIDTVNVSVAIGKASTNLATLYIFKDHPNANEKIIRVDTHALTRIFELDEDGDGEFKGSVKYGAGRGQFLKSGNYSRLHNITGTSGFTITGGEPPHFRVSMGVGNQSEWSLSTFDFGNLDQSDVTIKRDVDGAGIYSEAGTLLRIERDITSVTSADGSFMEWGNTGTTLGSIGKLGALFLNSTTPNIARQNSTHNNDDQSRLSLDVRKGEKLDGTVHTLSITEVGHDGAGDDFGAYWKLSLHTKAELDADIVVDRIKADELGVYLGDGGVTDYTQITDIGDIFQKGVGRFIESSNFKITAIGGYAVKLTNNTGVNSVEGQQVEADDADENSYKVADANSLMVVGYVYNAGVADGSEVWIVTGGIAEMLVDAGGCVHHDRMVSSATAGSAGVSNTPSVADHFAEIGHAIETVVGAGLAKVMIHLL